jgi:hypothetical protein
MLELLMNNMVSERVHYGNQRMKDDWLIDSQMIQEDRVLGKSI